MLFKQASTSYSICQDLYLAQPRMASDLPVPGQFPDLDAETQVPVLVGTSVAFALASSIAVVLRLYTRGYVVYSLGLDDATIAFAQVRAAVRLERVPALHDSRCCPLVFQS